MQDESSDILERLKHPELEEARRKERKGNTRFLWLRNILNLVFILLSIATMVSIGWYWNEPFTPMWCFFLGFVAVIIKMFEAFLRMPYLSKQKGIKQHARHHSQE